LNTFTITYNYNLGSGNNFNSLLHTSSGKTIAILGYIDDVNTVNSKTSAGLIQIDDTTKTVDYGVYWNTTTHQDMTGGNAVEVKDGSLFYVGQNEYVVE
jgi:hypothetical protein